MSADQLAPVSPSAQLVSTLLEDPATSPQDLQQAMDTLKDKQGQIRRKRFDQSEFSVSVFKEHCGMKTSCLQSVTVTLLNK